MSRKTRPPLPETLAKLRGAESLGQLRRFSDDPRKAVQQALERRRRQVKDENARLAGLMREERRLYRQGFELVAGVDEVGAGPLAGPVVAAAVILPKNRRIFGVNDSKSLSHAKRELIAKKIRQYALAIGIGNCSAQEIDQLNILQASLEAMRRAVTSLNPLPQALLVDARRVPHTSIPQHALIGGDGKSHSIAAASIIAKVHRDRLMGEYEQQYPGYGFSQHMGYGTAAHMGALDNLGPCPIHRLSFAPVRLASDKHLALQPEVGAGAVKKPAGEHFQDQLGSPQ